MHPLDLAIIIGYLALSLWIGLRYAKRASKSTAEFFLGGRSLPWWLGGLSMVATTFAADTPLAVTELVGQQGIAGNWLWWSFVAGGMLTTFIFAPLWRRANVMTEAEFIELRYSGKPARFLRGFKAFHLGFLLNIIIIAWVNVALVSILEVFFDLPHSLALLYTGLTMLLTAAYVSVSGLIGVAVTDAVQFVIAMAGCIVLAGLVVNSPEIGSIPALTEKVKALHSEALNFLPSVGGDGANFGKVLSLTIGTFLTFVAVQWWASWYPGAEPGGGGYIAQRMMSIKTERGAVWATLFFQVAHYCLRPWPWIIVGLCALVLYDLPSSGSSPNTQAEIIRLQQATGQTGYKLFTQTPAEIRAAAVNNPRIAAELEALLRVSEAIQTEAKVAGKESKIANALTYAADEKKGFVLAMRQHLPVGWRGLLLVAFLAAYMSTIATQLNWGASYLVNDLYRRFWRSNKSERHYVGVGRGFTLLLMAAGMVVSLFVHSISEAWAFLMQCGAGLGTVLILRWFWWRINAWAEISATITPFVATAFLAFHPLPFPDGFLLTIGCTVVVWIAVAFLTPATEEATLRQFYARVQPNGNWARYRNHLSPPAPLWLPILGWLSGILFTYSMLFLIGRIVLAQWSGLWLPLLLSLLACAIMIFVLRKMKFPADEMAKTNVLREET